MKYNQFRIAVVYFIAGFVWGNLFQAVYHHHNEVKLIHQGAVGITITHTNFVVIQ